MANACYMKVIGVNGKQIQGSVMQAGRENTIKVIELQGSVFIPVDNKTNEVRGNRTHEGFILTKVIDKSTPYFYDAVAKGDTWDNVQIDSYETVGGNEKLIYSIIFEGVQVVSAESRLFNVISLETESQPQVDIVKLRYRKITHDWKDGNIQASDDWQKPNIQK